MPDINPLAGFVDDIRRIQQIPPEKVNIDFGYLNKNAFKQRLNMMVNSSDEYSLSVFIKNNVEIIASDIVNGDKSYATLLVNPNFISAFVRAVSSIPITENLRLCCNKITYDYFISDNPDSNIKRRYLDLSKVVNRIQVNSLQAIGLDENTACNLALSRSSSLNERTNVKRLNFTIYNKDPEVMTEQMVVWIYEKLFNRISDLFLAIMFEVYPPQQEMEFGENFMEVYGVVGLAILTILNNMPSDKIAKVLMKYNNEWEYLERPRVRFSLHALSEDFLRILNVVSGLQAQGIDIP